LRQAGLYSLPYAGFSLPQIFTDADGTLYPDLPELVPTFYRPSSHGYLGPILWSPTTIPSWWNDFPRDKEAIYVSLGTSGRIDLLPVVLDAVTDLGLSALVATAGRADIRPIPGRLWVADYLPGVEAAQRVGLFICNGGSATVYQALAAGVPVIGIPTNLDQYLTMFYVRRAGVGELVRAGEASVAAIKKAISHALHNPSFRERSESLKARIAAYRPEVQLTDFLTKAMMPSVSSSRSAATSPGR
jgi:UDP:flavonoid glycosyltransferase YjiC (YdhE family)